MFPLVTTKTTLSSKQIARLLRDGFKAQSEHNYVDVTDLKNVTLDGHFDLEALVEFVVHNMPKGKL